MDIRFEDDRKKGRSPTTKLYLPTQEEQDAYEARASRSRTGTRSASEPGVRVKNPGISSFGRIGLIISGFLFASMVLFTLSGYERISRAYADINALNSEIDLTDLRINELDVQIECAVTIQDAQKAAESYGMRYPDKKQYVRIGDPLPFDNTTPPPTTSPTGGTTTTPETPATTTPDPAATSTSGGGEQPLAGG
ncbi:MAG: hypothetical protein PHW41_09200 [Eubacteriales bacterium]|nr:hypothetical protein [Eubacteriales bacterium]